MGVLVIHRHAFSSRLLIVLSGNYFSELQRTAQSRRTEATQIDGEAEKRH